MSGRTKRIIYDIVSSIALLAAFAGVFLLAYFGMGKAYSAAYIGVLVCFLVCLMLFPLHTVLHEAGHALGGLLCGMRVLSVSFGIYRLNWTDGFSFGARMGRDANGATALVPKRGEGARGKLIFALYAGAALNFLYAAVMFSLYFAVTKHPAMLFFALFAPLSLYEGAVALYPAELPAGPTDGKFALGLIRNTPDADVALRVMTAQGLLYTEEYSRLPHELLFDAPVVREDSAAFLALLQLRWRALFCKGEDATEPLSRLDALFGYVPEESRGSLAADLICGGALFPALGDMTKYAGELGGSTAAELAAAYALSRTEEDEARFRRTAERKKQTGERAFLGLLTDRLKQ